MCSLVHFWSRKGKPAQIFAQRERYELILSTHILGEVRSHRWKVKRSDKSIRTTEVDRIASIKRAEP
jgi:hypothetical protein